MVLLRLEPVLVWVQSSMPKTTETTEILTRDVRLETMVILELPNMVNLAILLLVMVNLILLLVIPLELLLVMALAIPLVEISQTKLTTLEFVLEPMKLVMSTLPRTSPGPKMLKTTTILELLELFLVLLELVLVLNMLMTTTIKVITRTTIRTITKVTTRVTKVTKDLTWLLVLPAIQV